MYRLTHRFLPVVLFFALIALAPAQDAKPPISDLVTTQTGKLPIILSAPHGGTKEVPGVPERKGDGLPKGGKGFFAGRDTGTEELAQVLSTAIEDRKSTRLNSSHRT